MRLPKLAVDFEVLEIALDLISEILDVLETILQVVFGVDNLQDIGGNN